MQNVMTAHGTTCKNDFNIKQIWFALNFMCKSDCNFSRMQKQEMKAFLPDQIQIFTGQSIYDE